jgi:hypothetical protein
MILYTATVFLGAFLLFQVQPLIAKLVLPWFGGSASVWVTALLFFQVLLLGGYLYAHGLVSRLPQRKQAILHALLLGASLLVLPVALPSGLRPDGTETPVLLLLTILFAAVGAPYFLLSTTSPLLQAWYARSSARSLPYRLFGLSNLASLLGLLAYPFVVEPNLTLHAQRVLWSSAYGVFAVLFIATAYASSSRNEASAPRPAVEGPPPTGADKLRWLLLAAGPSMLLLSVTSHLTQNVASVPFLWVLPLGLYLLTFTIAFEFERLYHRGAFFWLAVLALLVMGYRMAYGDMAANIRTSIATFSTGLFICSLACHGELARLKPPPGRLTSFYIMVSAGGTLGGVLAGLAAPLLLPGSFELAVSLLFCALLLPLVLGRDRGRATRTAGWFAAAITLAAGAVFISGYLQYAFVMERSFYGSLRVHDQQAGTPAHVRILFHGVIDHGRQFASRELRREPLTYYSRNSGIGILLQQRHRPAMRIGVVGLGIGTLSAYARPGDVIRFYEIDPAVERLARDYFTYLADCAGTVEVVLGDGRLSMEREKDQRFDVLVLDAFSGDMVPMHLLTREALRLYVRHLAPGGVLAFHITNRNVDLAPVLLALGHDLGWQMLFHTSLPDDDRHIETSTWALLSRERISVPALTMASWVPGSRPDLPVWTDDFSNLFRVLK